MSSWRIGRAFRINIYLHWTMLLLPVWILLTNVGHAALLPLALTAALFGCVVLHELGHALAARHFGIRTRDITLYPIGGVARLESVGHRPWEELCIAIAGPAVNVVLAIGFGLGWYALAAGNAVLAYTTFFGQFLYWLAALNVGMVLFNLLPAFPMDGGRVLRALLASGMGQVKATRIAAGVGMVMAVLIGMAGVLYFQSPMLAIIGVFVFLAGQQELQAVEIEERMRLRAASASAAPYANDLWWGTHVWPPRQPSAAVARPEEGMALRPTVTVYVWDAERQGWVKQ